MCPASTPDGLRGIGSVGFGGFCAEVVAVQGQGGCWMLAVWAMARKIGLHSWYSCEVHRGP